MRSIVPLATLLLATGCAGTLYSHFAGPAAKPADEVYACVQNQLKTLGYKRTQYNESTRWWVGQKVMRDQNSSGLYHQTLEVLDTKVNTNDQGGATLDIKASTFEQYTTARGEDQQQVKSSARVQADARTLGQECTK